MTEPSGAKPTPPSRVSAVAPRSRLLVEAALAVVGMLVFVLLARAYVDGGLVVSFDDNVSRWVADSLPGSIESIARVVTWLGGPIGAGVVTLVAVVVLWHASRRADVLFLAAAVVGINILVPVLKAVYERARPDLGTVPLPHSYSFPSGHAATAVVLYGALGVLLAERASTRLRAAGWLAGAALLALAIGASRVLLNVHFVSDVAAGFAVGLAWLCCCLIVRDVMVGSRGEASASPQGSPSTGHS